MPLSRAIAPGLGQDLQPVVEAIGEVRHGDDQGDFHHLLVGIMLEHLLARRLRARRAGQFAGIAAPAKFTSNSSGCMVNAICRRSFCISMALFCKSAWA